MSEPIIERAATAADLPALARIAAAGGEGAWSLDAFARELTLAWSHTEVLARGEEILGFVVFWLSPPEAEVLNIAVAIEARRRGLGRRLLERVVAWARRDGATRILLEVRRDNTPARALYRGLGFVEQGSRRGYYRDGEDAVLMVSTL